MNGTGGLKKGFLDVSPPAVTLLNNNTNHLDIFFSQSFSFLLLLSVAIDGGDKHIT